MVLRHWFNDKKSIIGLRCAVLLTSVAHKKIYKIRESALPIWCSNVPPFLKNTSVELIFVQNTWKEAPFLIKFELLQTNLKRSFINNLVEIYCNVDDFTKTFVPKWKKQRIETQEKMRNKPSGLSESEVITLLILFHQSDYKTLKHFYVDYVSQHLTQAFPTLVSYSRFVRLQKSVLVILAAYLHAQRGKNTGISFVDSTRLCATEVD